MTTPAHFLMVGNGPYANRGCEAIVRGTMAILRAEFGMDIRATVMSFASPEELASQAAAETDPQIRHVLLPAPTRRVTRKWAPSWWSRQYWRIYDKALRTMGAQPLGPKQLQFTMDLTPLEEEIATADCALQIGGDNYSLDYGLPISFMLVDRHLWGESIPVVIWGASVGPFDAYPAFARVMPEHLSRMSCILVRESLSYSYLRGQGLSNALELMPDPAFVMSAAAPISSKGCPSVPDGTVGINFSPLMARFVTKGNRTAWIDRCVEITRAVCDHTGRPVLLIPHVTVTRTNDHALLSEVQSRLAASIQVECVGPSLSAAETKWVISRCSAFIGARTHATIAAWSSGVPTVSLAYSRKAVGLNQDIFGSQEYCIMPDQVSAEAIVKRLDTLLARQKEVRSRLAEVIPEMETAAYRAAQSLRRAIDGPKDLRRCGCRVCRSSQRLLARADAKDNVVA